MRRHILASIAFLTIVAEVMATTSHHHRVQRRVDPDDLDDRVITPNDRAKMAEEKRMQGAGGGADDEDDDPSSQMVLNKRMNGLIKVVKPNRDYYRFGNGKTIATARGPHHIRNSRFYKIDGRFAK